MDHELKQRLIGAVVVTALAAIFIPMLFDDPVDSSGKTVTELTIPEEPAHASDITAQNLPQNKEQVLNRTETDLTVSEEELESSHSTGNQAPDNLGSDTTAEQPVMEAVSEDQAVSETDNSVKPEESKLDEPQSAKPYSQKGIQSDTTQPPFNKYVEPVVKVKPDTAAAEKPVKKAMISDKPKVKANVASVKKKTATAASQDDNKKANTKLVRYSIQAGSFSKKENAQALVEKLRKQGLPATVDTRGSLFRVKVGPALDKNKAAEMRAKLDKQHINSLLISE